MACPPDWRGRREGCTADQGGRYGQLTRRSHLLRLHVQRDRGMHAHYHLEAGTPEKVAQEIRKSDPDPTALSCPREPFSCGYASPANLSVHPALYLSVSAQSPTSKRPKEPQGASSVIRVNSPSCLACLSIRSANLFNMSRRLFGGVAYHAGNAASAAATAASTSCSPASGTSSATSEPCLALGFPTVSYLLFFESTY